MFHGANPCMLFRGPVQICNVLNSSPLPVAFSKVFFNSFVHLCTQNQAGNTCPAITLFQARGVIEQLLLECVCVFKCEFVCDTGYWCTCQCSERCYAVLIALSVTCRCAEPELLWKVFFFFFFGTRAFTSSQTQRFARAVACITEEFCIS